MVALRRGGPVSARRASASASPVSASKTPWLRKGWTALRKYSENIYALSGAAVAQGSSTCRLWLINEVNILVKEK